ncbi:MAG TPA: nodulation protein NfeD [Abditibacteriaceae bacterium]|nr:nodulation protein NfeD [Abditibacteriaceae bacterium]
MNEMRQVRSAITFIVLVALALHMLAAPALAANGEVHVLTIDGAINPLTARYLERGLREAKNSRAAAVVVRLDTPGGLETSMRKMTSAMLASPVPVVVHVAPAGAHAASAGMFLTIAAHVAAMAPGTNIGAAHPVSVGGEKPDRVMSDKVTNDAAALARSLANTRGRNAKWAESAVRQSVSITAEEALQQNVIDLVESDLPRVLQRIDGRKIKTTRGQMVLQTAQAPRREQPLSWPERILMALADPNIAYILFTLGSIGLVAELYNPGSIFPGVTGAICLVLAFAAFGSLPINWAGVLLLLIAMALFAAEVASPGIGFFAASGTAAFVLGSLMLFTPFNTPSPVYPIVRVSPWLIGGSTVSIAGFFLVGARAVLKTRKNPVTTGIEALIGQNGVVLSPLSELQTGHVRVDSEVWSALSDGEAIGAGDRVQIVKVEGVTLRVRRCAEPTQTHE